MFDEELRLNTRACNARLSKQTQSRINGRGRVDLRVSRGVFPSGGTLEILNPPASSCVCSLLSRSFPVLIVGTIPVITDDTVPLIMQRLIDR